ncbi:MAG: 1-deoxy-D-xylulose-5-phosphate synthase [Ruminococcaceae bacterium]|jgi:1-deoxy-D-xylulose-5-phosphate synthase|nr:1-deoxy-D-xylulose-5-phosphate synthase [Oscillospiraceae bacterium]
METHYLKNISSPADVKKLDEKELDNLAKEIREVLISTVSQNGGHLASNLGVVELTIALHRVFNSPKDKIVWDVGHQVYTHKLLTGRFDSFESLRKENGISGFSRPSESEHDIFYSGHSSTSISSALGIATAEKINGGKNHTIAVIGDGALTGGLAYEALNNAGRQKCKLIVILNDNEMSISKNVGGVARYLAVIRSKPGYFMFKAHTEKFIKRIPLIGKSLARLLFKSKTRLKNFMYKSTFFEDLGFQYMGPIDGHNIEQITNALEGAKLVNKPVLLHINTIKGKGYDFAEKDPSQFHGISKFNVFSGEPNYSSGSFSDVAGEFLCNAAAKDKRICTVTAAMKLGTGLDSFSKKFPERFFDVGIAEEHAVTFASGLARDGMLPVFAVYSTFLQRAYDQLIHDCALQKEHIVLAVDRAGFVGEDGETHQGLFDVAYLNSIPDINVYSPSNYSELNKAFFNAFYKDKRVVAIRYPRGTESEILKDYKATENNFDIIGEENAENAIVTYGRVFASAFEALKMLNEKGKEYKIIKLNRIKPIDIKAVESALNCKKVFFFEESLESGSVGERFAYLLSKNSFNGKFIHTAVDDGFVKQASVSSLLHKYKLDCEGICEVISNEQ